jgi:hypothetical protein
MRASKKQGQPSRTTGRDIREQRRESAEGQGQPRRRSLLAERCAVAEAAAVSQRTARGGARRDEQPAAAQQRGGRRLEAGSAKQQQQQQQQRRLSAGAAAAHGSGGDGDTADAADGPSKRSLSRARKRKFRSAEQAFTLLAGHDACVQLVLSGAPPSTHARTHSVARSTLIGQLTGMCTLPSAR